MDIVHIYLALKPIIHKNCAGIVLKYLYQIKIQMLKDLKIRLTKATNGDGLYWVDTTSMAHIYLILKQRFYKVLLHKIMRFIVDKRDHIQVQVFRKPIEWYNFNLYPKVFYFNRAELAKYVTGKRIFSNNQIIQFMRERKSIYTTNFLRTFDFIKNPELGMELLDNLVSINDKHSMLPSSITKNYSSKKRGGFIKKYELLEKAALKLINDTKNKIKFIEWIEIHSGLNLICYKNITYTELRKDYLVLINKAQNETLVLKLFNLKYNLKLVYYKSNIDAHSKIEHLDQKFRMLIRAECPVWKYVQRYPNMFQKWFLTDLLKYKYIYEYLYLTK